jgi:choice-of-anchor C domain-containing protein
VAFLVQCAENKSGGTLRQLPVAVFALAVAWPCLAAPFQNGSFENASVDPGGSFVTLADGSMQITGWTVISGDIDYIGTYWVASTGVRSLDLVGDQNVGGIEQTFDTVPGATYRVSFDLAGNPQGPPTIKPLTVNAGGVVQDYTFDTTGKTVSNMGWVTNQLTFTASGPTTTLSFISDTTGLGCCYGAALDNVIVQLVQLPPAPAPVPLEPAAPLAALSILAGALLIHRRRQ